VTEDDVIRIAKEANLVFRFDYFEIASENSDGIMINDLTKFANLVAAAEREACADACKKIDVFGMYQKLQNLVIEDCVEAIRARGNNDV
jgi:hypothetical protein